MLFIHVLTDQLEVGYQLKILEGRAWCGGRAYRL